MEKTPRSPQAALGVLAAGAAYVPLDPRAPWRRCRTILQDCSLSALIVDEGRLASLAPLLDGMRLPLLVVDADRAALAGCPAQAAGRTMTLSEALEARVTVPGDAAPDDVAYIL